MQGSKPLDVHVFIDQTLLISYLSLAVLYNLCHQLMRHLVRCALVAQGAL